MEENKKLIIAALVVILGGNAGSFVGAINPDIRSDPFTGTDGIELTDRVDMLEMDVFSCRERNSSHRELQAGILAELISDVKNNRYLIERCMRATEQ